MAEKKVLVNSSNNHTVEVKDGFNWFAFIFGVFYLLYKGLIAHALFYALVSLVVGGITAGLGLIVVWVVIGFKTNQHLIDKYLEKGYVLEKEESRLLG